MSGVLVDGIKPLMLDGRLANPPFDDAEVGLFAGALVPTHATVMGDIVEVTGTGYARQPLVAWASAALDGTFRAFSNADPITFGPAGANDWSTITGWFWYSPGAALLIRATRLLVPIALVSGDSYTWAPRETLTGE